MVTDVMHVRYSVFLPKRFAMQDDNPQKFMDSVEETAQQNTLIKMTLSKPKLKQDELRNVYVKPVMIKDKRMYSFTYHYQRRDEVKNYDTAQMMEVLNELLPARFLNAVLFTLTEDCTLLVSPKGKTVLQTKKVQVNREQDLSHDKQKRRLVNPVNPWWFHLGLTTREGKVTADMQHKFKQICKYTEIVEGLLKPMHFDDPVHIADMEAGKGYLTFALYELMTGEMGMKTDIKGIEVRTDLVQKINEIIKVTKLEGIEFVESTISDFKPERIDVLIALHACNTATDDAIASGIRNGAGLIVCAPCCHKQIRQEMENSGIVNPVTRYGIFLEREAAMLTDAIRAMILEYYGYKTQVMEFIETEHTPKNILLAGTKTSGEVATEEISASISAMKKEYGIKRHYLETILGLDF